MTILCGSLDSLASLWWLVSSARAENGWGVLLSMVALMLDVLMTGDCSW